MEVAWSQLREEAHRLAQDIGQSGREHHSLANSRAVWDAIRAHGVPPEHREWVWPILLHDQSMKLQRQHTESGASYSQLLHGMAEDLQETETSSSLEQAQEEAMERFHHLNPFQERKIRRILLAYAKSKDAFYYCHGMVESCVVLSTFLVEEDAFWSFRMLLEVLLPKYFDESVVDFHTDCLVLQELLRVHDPALSEHFALLGVSIQLLCTKWFFSFFAESMPFEVVCRLYDIMFVDICSRQLGSKIVFSTSLSVLLYLSSTLVEIQDVNVVLDVINEFCWTTLNEYSVAESFLDLINFMHEQINDEELAALRQKYRAQLAQEEEHRKTMQRKIQTKKSSKKLKLEKQGSAEQQDHPRLNMEILCTKWLVTCFLTSLPIFCGLKVIDMLLARSKEKQRASRVLLGVGISIFFTLRETLLDAKDAGEVLLAINDYFAREMTKTTVEMDKFLHFCLIITDQLEPDIVEEFRLVHKDEVMERFAAFEAKKIEMRQQLEEAKAKQRKVASAPPSPSKTERLSTLSASSIMSGKSNGNNRISGLSSYISNPLRSSGGSKTTTTGAGDDKESHKRYQRVDVLQAHHSFSEDLVKMEDQLEDLADLFLRGKIDEKEHSCIRAQIVRKWCKGMNSPQSAMVRVQCVKHTYCERSGEGFTNTQRQDYERLGLHTSDGLDAVGEEDRLELLSELEVDAAASPSAKSSPTLWEPIEENESQLPPLSRSKSGKRVSIGNAAVLFINENQPVTMSTPRGSSRPSSRRSERSAIKSKFTVCSLYSSGPSNALLRTSPWTYRGVVYFVSFFLQERSQQQEEEAESTEETEERRLMIKIYEPMSSVESQMSVDVEDLRQDFGEEALEAFQSGQYRTLCDIMLRQLDKMMGAGSGKSAPLTPPQPSEDIGKQASALDLLLQDSESDHGQDDRPEIVDELTAEDVSQLPESEAVKDPDALEASALKIQCAARQQQARGEVNRVRAQKKQVEASALRIQCAARQKQARQKIDRVRAEKKMIEAVPEGDELQVDSEEYTAADQVEEEQSEDIAVPESRPGTVMSYASDQFEDELEAA
ncbi:hypothetical protein JG687_00016003 [Phytophthora cactorum]|uniref:Rab-GAP TBC domain-containing protein n=1 Tax=Phytophthora cactorum TaxID=29920 RepID=A0A8T1TX82_9STRA|nr:hypothetical protein JG687_00016003 [Phytophthora cactorum]